MVSGGAGGSISLRQATANSVNTVYAQLVTDIGPEDDGRDGEEDGHHEPAVGLPGRRPRRQRRAPCSTSRTASRRSPTAASTTIRPRSPGSSSPTARSTCPRSRGHAGDLRRRRLHGRRRDEGRRSSTAPPPARGSAVRRPARPAPPRTRPTPGSSATRRTSRPRSGSATRTSASPLPGYGGRPRRADLARLHDGRGDRALRRLPRAAEPGRPLRLLQRAHGRPRLRDRRRRRPRRRPTRRRTRTPTSRPAGGYDPDLYAPGAGQEPAPTPDRRTRRTPATSRPVAAAARRPAAPAASIRTRRGRSP